MPVRGQGDVRALLPGLDDLDTLGAWTLREGDMNATTVMIIPAVGLVTKRL
jgi:hypothetical protein